MELVVVIVITGILAAATALFIGSPVQGFVDQSRRASLVDAADLALLRMSRDLRTALPNSVRVSGDGQVMEMFPTLDGERYRAESPGDAADRLEIGVADLSFDTFGALNGGVIPAGARLAVYPFGGASGNPYAAGANIVTAPGIVQGVAAVTVGGGTESRVTLSGAGHAFPYASPGQRIYLVEGPVSYVCDGSGQRLLRYAGYSMQASVPSATILAGSGVTPDVVVDRVQSCAFAYAASGAASARNAVAQLALVMAGSDAPAERVRLSRQVHVDNAP